MEDGDVVLERIDDVAADNLGGGATDIVDVLSLLFVPGDPGDLVEEVLLASKS